MTTANHSSSCPNCGIAVSAGYRKCPKCHGELPDQPGAGGQAPSAEAQRIQGGTALDAGAAPPWFAIGVGVALVAIGLVAFALTRGAGDSADPSVRVRQTTSATVHRRALAPPTEDHDRQRAEPAARPGGTDTRSSAVKLFEASELLQAEIEGRRLWATVEVDGAGLAIRSAYCADGGMKASIDKLVETLQTSGAQTVTCYERHGPQVFQRVLGNEPLVP